jgi:hypothetical protein
MMENINMMNWYDMNRTNEVRYQDRLSEAEAHRLALVGTLNTQPASNIRVWLARVLREGARRLDNQFDTSRYERSSETAR